MPKNNTKIRKALADAFYAVVRGSMWGIALGTAINDVLRLLHYLSR